MVRALPAVVRHGGTQLDLLPATRGIDRRRLGIGGTTRVPLRGQARIVRFPQDEAQRRRLVVAETTRSRPPARRAPRADTRATATASEAKRAAARRVPECRPEDDA